PTTPFLMVTAYAEVESAVAAMKLGAKDYLTKPVKPEELLDLVARVVTEDAAASEAGKPKNTAAHLSSAPPSDAPPEAGVRPAAEPTRLEDLEKDTVLRVLEREGGNRTHAAKLLGISIRTLQRKLNAWGLTAQGEATAEARPNDRTA
ncbi:MAG TPA: helix-turn-helix domain-containing protein, partial [Pirellulales bacterium]|nr:helix-turn-helix domain-containing protein [Pirellulales bacterium]